MEYPRFKQKSKLTNLSFDEAVRNSLTKRFKVDHGVEGTPNRGIYTPILTVEVFNSKTKKVRLSISWQAQFVFNVPKNINEGDLFGAIKSISDDLENFVLKNKDQFDEIKIEVDEIPHLREKLHEVLAVFYKNLE